MNLASSSILQRNLPLHSSTIYFSITYFRLILSNKVSIKNHSIDYEPKNCSYIEFGPDLTCFLESLRDVFVNKYINGTTTAYIKKLSHGDLKIIVDTAVEKGTTFFSVVKCEDNVEIVCLKKKKDLLLLMQNLREFLLYGFLFKADELKIVENYLLWWNSYEGTESSFTELKSTIQNEIVLEIIKKLGFSGEYFNKVFVILSGYSDFITSIALLDITYSDENPDSNEVDSNDVSKKAQLVINEQEIEKQSSNANLQTELNSSATNNPGNQLSTATFMHSIEIPSTSLPNDFLEGEKFQLA